MASHENARAAARRIVEQVLAEHAHAGDGTATSTVSTIERSAAVGAPEAQVAQVAADRPVGGGSGARTEHPDSPAWQTARRIVEQVLADDQARRDALAADATDGGAVAATEGVIDLTATTQSGGGQEPEPLADRLFEPPVEELLFGADPSSRGLATVPVPDPGPGPEPLPGPLPDPEPFPSPDPLPDPDPFPPDPLPPDPLPDPDPFPPDPLPPDPAPPDPAPQPLSGVDEGVDAGVELTAARREAVDAARRIVQEVVAAHEEAERAREIEDRARRAEHERQEQQRQEATLRTAAPIVVAEPELDKLPHPQLPTSSPSGPPPIPAAARQPREPSPLGEEPEAQDPAADGAAVAVSEAPTVPLSSQGGSDQPRTGRWLMTTVVGALALALLFPLAVRALRTLVTLGSLVTLG